MKEQQETLQEIDWIPRFCKKERECRTYAFEQGRVNDTWSEKEFKEHLKIAIKKYFDQGKFPKATRDDLQAFDELCWGPWWHVLSTGKCIDIDDILDIFEDVVERCYQTQG